MIIYLYNLFASNYFVTSKFGDWNIGVLFFPYPHSLE